MLIVKPYAKILFLDSLEQGIELLRRVEFAARVSHRSEEAQTSSSWERFLKAVVLEHGDWSVTEHCSVTVEATVDRGITHEWVRHRIGAYTQESSRFVNYAKKMPASFIMPESLSFDDQRAWTEAIEATEATYRELVGCGVTPQIARSVFPTALASKLVVTYNLRNWRHFFLMRTSKEAHPQMREVTKPLLKEFQSKIPLLYDDIKPGRRQIENLRLAR